MNFTLYFALHLVIGFGIWVASLPLTGVHQPWDTYLYCVAVLISFGLGIVHTYQSLSTASSTFLGMWLGQMTALYNVVDIHPKSWLEIYWVTTAFAATVNVEAVSAGQQWRRSIHAKSQPPV